MNTKRDFINQEIKVNDIVITGQNISFESKRGFVLYEIVRLTEKCVVIKKTGKPKSQEKYKYPNELIGINALKQFYPEGFL